jgi:predicted CXXCH cytochrome family protein
MRGIVMAMAVATVGTISVPRDADAQDSAGSCIECHAMLSGPLADPVELFADDVHAAAGFGCSACHGGDPTVGGAASMDPAAGFIGTPDHSQVPDLCGRCHSNGELMRQYNPSIRIDQLTEFLTSVHGQQLFGNDDQAVATCASCHGAHGIRPASDPRSSVHSLRVAQTCGACHADESHMAPYGIPTDQLDLYESSVHWRMMSEAGDLSAPTCNDCHGNHGAVPPGISWVGAVCGQCHVVMAEAFDQSQHSRTFTALGVPGCAFCHKNHEVQEAGDELLGLDEGAVCRSCHSSGDPGGQSATRMRGSIDTLRVHIDSARHVLERAENAGMEVSASLASLADARSALVKARAAVHSFDPETVDAEIEPGTEIAAEAVVKGAGALREIQIRRIGLAVSVVVIGLLILGLILKIKEIEQPT